MALVPEPLTTIFAELAPLDAGARVAVRRRFDGLPESHGAFGSAETTLELFAAASADAALGCLHKASWLVALADHGVAARWPGAGVSTAELCLKLQQGRTATSALAAGLGVRATIVDAGIDARAPQAESGLTVVKTRRATGDLARGACLTEDEAEDLMAAGVRVGERLEAGSMLLLSGGGRACEISSAALLLALQPASDVHSLLPRPVGFDDIALSDARRLVVEVVRNHAPRLGSPLSMLASLGGFEHAFMAGLMAVCARRRIPVLFDGLAAMATARWLASLDPRVASFLFSSDLREDPELPVMCAPQALGSRTWTGAGALTALATLRAIRDACLGDQALQ